MKSHEYIDALVKKGEHILSLCEVVKKENSPHIVHHLPVKDESKNWNCSDNWNLSESEKATVEECLQDLREYAKGVISACFREYPNVEIDSSTEILPPWIVFPTYAATSIGWRMGIGENYDHIYQTMIEEMTAEEFDLYKAKWPEPPFAKLRSGYEKKEKRLNGEAEICWDKAELEKFCWTDFDLEDAYAKQKNER